MPTEAGEQLGETHTRATDRSIVRNLRIVGLCTLLSRLLGLTRDVFMAALFGAGTTLDVFIVAFRLPNLSRQLFGEGALTAAFLPIFLRERSERGDEAARSTMTAVAIALGAFLSISVLICEAGIFAALTMIEFSPPAKLLLELLAILLPYLVLICLAAMFSAALHAMRQFLWPALVPVLLNVMWLTGIGVAVIVTQEESVRVKIVSGMLTGAGVLQLMIPLTVLSRMRMGLSATWRNSWPNVRELLANMLPIVLGMSLIQMNSVLDSLLAWGLSTPDAGGPAPLESLGLPALLQSGTTTALYLGQRMYQFPMGVFGMALGTVLYPLLAQHAQQGEIDRLRADLTKGIRLVIAIAIPASAGLVLLANPLTDLLFRHGEFNTEDTALAANMIAMYGAGVWTYIGVAIFNRAYYAVGDRATPVRYAICALVLNIFFNILLVVLMGGIGIALGSVLATIVQLALSVFRFNRRQVTLHWNLILETLWRSLLATLIMSLCSGGVLAWMTGGNSMSDRLLKLIVPLGVGIISFLAVARVLKMSEISEIYDRRGDQ